MLSSIATSCSNIYTALGGADEEARRPRSHTVASRPKASTFSGTGTCTIVPTKHDRFALHACMHGGLLVRPARVSHDERRTLGRYVYCTMLYNVCMYIDRDITFLIRILLAQNWQNWQPQRNGTSSNAACACCVCNWVLPIASPPPT